MSNKNVGLLDVDSKIPNLALMKISAYHKKMGDKVSLTSPLFCDQYEILYASKVYRFTESPILPDDAITGGSGYDLTTVLNHEIEAMFPDYSLYNCRYAIGFTSRGCNRNCPFCIVREKEGRFRITGDIYDFWNGQERIMLLDNSLNTDNRHFVNIVNQLIVENMEVDFNQGLDIRYLNKEQAVLLSKVRLWKQIHFAWDRMISEEQVLSGINILKQNNLGNKSMFYVLIGYDTTPEEDLYRVEKLRELEIDPFAMPYNKYDDYQKKFARWVNHKAIFKTVKWEDYEP